MSDVRVLVRHRLGTLCANHAAVAGRREMGLEELRRECLGSDRRLSGDRRAHPRLAFPAEATGS
jgi:hypothetical protein